MENEAPLWNSLLRVEGASSSPGRGWDQVQNVENYWVLELPGYSNLKPAVIGALECLDSSSSRIVLHLGLPGEGQGSLVLMDHEFLAFLGSKGVDLEIWS
jgi:hypothetical protein